MAVEFEHSTRGYAGCELQAIEYAIHADHACRHRVLEMLNDHVKDVTSFHVRNRDRWNGGMSRDSDGEVRLNSEVVAPRFE